MATDDPHIIHLENRVDRLETTVSKIEMGVQKLLDRPVLPGFGQIVGTLVSTLTMCALILGFAEWRLTRAVDPLEMKSAAAFSSLVQLDARVWENKVASAVQEERSRWLENKLNVSTVAK